MSLTHNPVNWFEIPVNDLARARQFYEKVLEIEMQPFSMGESEMAWFPAGYDLPGAAGTLLQSEGYEPSMKGSVVYINVADLEATLGRVSENGGDVLMPKTNIGEFGFVGLIKDTEGNRVGLHSKE